MALRATVPSSISVTNQPLCFGVANLGKNTLLRLGSDGAPRRRFSSITTRRDLGLRLRSSVAGVEAAESEKTEDTKPIKDFLEELKGVGRVRIIVNTGVGILESVTTLEKLFYHTIPGRGEYANLMNKDENVDFHLLINKVKTAKFAKGKSMTGDIPTYSVRLLDDEDKAAALILVMWKPDTKGEYDPGQVETFEALLTKHGETYHFKK